jgi:hypothetical protein
VCHPEGIAVNMPDSVSKLSPVCLVWENPNRPARQKRIRVYSVYVDDSGKDRIVQVMGAVMIPSDTFRLVEQQFGYIIQQILAHYPEVLSHRKFEFHATDMWNRNEPWDMVSDIDINKIFSLLVQAIEYIGRPCITYGRIDISTYECGQEGQRRRINATFERCCHSIADWFHNCAAPNEFGTMYYDDPNDTVIEGLLRKTYRALRLRANTSPITTGVLGCMSDDIYFGDSRESIGLQLADLCSWLIMRQSSGSALSEDNRLYQRLKPHIFVPPFSDGA